MKLTAPVLAAALAAFAAAASAQDVEHMPAAQIDVTDSIVIAEEPKEPLWPEAIGPLINWAIGPDLIIEMASECASANAAENTVHNAIANLELVDFVFDEFRERARNHLSTPDVLWGYYEQHRDAVVDELQYMSTGSYIYCVQNLSSMADSLKVAMNPAVLPTYRELLRLEARSERMSTRSSDASAAHRAAENAVYVDEKARSTAILTAQNATYDSDEERNKAVAAANDAEYVDTWAKAEAIRKAKSASTKAAQQSNQAWEEANLASGQFDRMLTHLGWGVNGRDVRFGLRRFDEGGLKLVETYLKMVLDMRSQLGAMNRPGLIDTSANDDG